MSNKSPWSDLFQSLGQALGSLVDVAEQSKEFKDKPKVQTRVRARTLDGGSLDDLKDLASKLRGLGASSEPATPPPPQTLELELHEEADYLTVLISHPGLTPGRLEISVTGDMLEVQAYQGEQAYHGECQLPFAVDDSNREMKIHRGLIELRWPRPSAPPAPRARRKR